MQTRPRTLLSSLVLFGIGIYRNLFSSILLHSCRFFPTCSEYAALSVERHGALRGLWRALTRICRCHPFCRGGFDPVR